MYMMVTKELLKQIEDSIGYGCKVSVVPSELGLILMVSSDDRDTGAISYFERDFSFAEMRNEAAIALQSHFVLAAKKYFDNQYHI